MKRFLSVLILVLTLCFFTSCGNIDLSALADRLFDIDTGEHEENGSTVLPDDEIESDIILAVYTEAQGLGYEGTLSEFLELVNGKDGKDGKDGRGIDNITVYNGDLLIHMTDKSIINLGPIGGSGADGQTPYIGDNGNWWIGNTDTEVKAEGADGKDGADGQTPYIGDNGNWWIGNTDTKVKAEGTDGEDGVDGTDGKDGADGQTPYIGDNGNWWIGNTDTEVKAEGTDGKDGVDGTDGKDGVDGTDGEDGKTPYIGDNGNWWIGNTDTKVKAEGTDGEDGVDGTDGEDGVDGTDGEDGVGIDDMEINADGDLIVTLTDGTIKNLGQVTATGTAFSGIGILQIELINNTELVITLTNGIKLTCENFESAIDNALISNITIDTDGNVSATLTTGSIVDYGKISSARITVNHEIIVTFEDGTEQAFGTISAVAGAVCNHVYSPWLPGEAETCCSMGFNSRVCVYCGVLDYDFIPAYGHTWNGDTYLLVSPTATENGNALVSCSVCAVAKLEILTPDGDFDSDGLTNGDEVTIFGTNLLKADSDEDGLLDYEEIFNYSTNALSADTDGDDATDYAEVTYGTDPLAAATNGTFEVKTTIDTEDTVKPGIELSGIDASQLNSLEIVENDYFEEETLGYMGQAYDYNMEGDIAEAVVSFEFESPATVMAVSASADPIPTIYLYDPNENSLTPLYTTVEGNVASATVDEFGSYILLDRRLYEEQMAWVDNWYIGDSSNTYTDLEIVFVIDDSGSMTSNDGTNQRLTVAKNIIDTFGENAKAGIVKFASLNDIETLSGSDLVVCNDAGKAALKNTLTTANFNSSGLTYIYSAITEALDLYSDSSSSTMKVMIVLSDGYPEGETTTQAAAIQAAQSKGVEVYTVGLGSNTSRFEECLYPLSNQTGGVYQHASDTSLLMELYNKIRTTIDLSLDTDGDELPDYYEDNMVSFDGVTAFATDKNDSDTDGDRLFDGEEIVIVKVYNMDKTKLTFYGKVFSDPTLVDSDGDGVDDLRDRYPMNANRD